MNTMQSLMRNASISISELVLLSHKDIFSTILSSSYAKTSDCEISVLIKIHKSVTQNTAQESTQIAFWTILSS